MFKFKKSAAGILCVLLAATVVLSAFSGCDKGSESVSSSVSTSKAESTPSKTSADVSSKTEASSKPEEKSEPEESKLVPPTVEDITDLTTSKIEKESVTLSWQKSSNADGYEIERKEEEDGTYKNIKSLTNPSINTYTDSEVTSGKRYYYRMRAYIKLNDEYYYSGYTSAKATTELSDVENLSVASSDSKNITIAWDYVSGASGYIISRMDENSTDYYDVSTLSDGYTTEFTDTGLTVAKGYRYRVKAYMEVDGENYLGGYAEIRAYTKPAAPEFKLDYKDKKLTASWSEVDGAEGYKVYLSTTEEGDYDLVGTTDKTSLTFDVKNNNVYYVRVCAYFTTPYGETQLSSYKTKSKTCGNVPKVHGYVVGNTYIEVNLEKQHMWFYKDGKEIVSTDVVTGTKNYHDTPTGLYYIINKSSPAQLVGETWDVEVNFWLGVTYDGVGIHDSTWRGGYGGSIYTYDGSHGCINTPYDQVKKIYDNCDVNTPVVIY